MSLLWERQMKIMENKEMPRQKNGFQNKTKQQSGKA
jgi:hypothetical protein